MAKNFILQWLRAYGSRQWVLGMERSNAWAGQSVVELAPHSLLDVGCGNGNQLFRFLKQVPAEYYGVEGSPALKVEAEKRGIKVFSYDLNSRWPFEDNKFDVIFSTQVIEHVHNTRLFAEEAYRVLKPGGTAVITSENLCSFLNCIALCMGFTPFSLMQICGHYMGNPIGLHYQEPTQEPLPVDHPAFSGVSGHVRVLTVRQAKELFERTGFETQANSMGMMPLPDTISRILEKVIKNRGHFLTIKARKPAR